MTLAEWALRPGELRPLAGPLLRVYAVRLVSRVQPWLPPASLVDDAFASALDPDAHPPPHRHYPVLVELAREAAQQAQAGDAVTSACVQAASALVCAVDAALGPAPGKARAAVVQCAKHVGSVPAVLGHAGLLDDTSAADPVDTACVPLWALLRADVGVVAAGDPRAALWPRGVPAWMGLAPDW